MTLLLGLAGDGNARMGAWCMGCPDVWNKRGGTASKSEHGEGIEGGTVFLLFDFWITSSLIQTFRFPCNSTGRANGQGSSLILSFFFEVSSRSYPDPGRMKSHIPCLKPALLSRWGYSGYVSVPWRVYPRQDIHLMMSVLVETEHAWNEISPFRRHDSPILSTHHMWSCNISSYLPWSLKGFISTLKSADLFFLRSSLQNWTPCFFRCFFQKTNPKQFTNPPL